MSLSIFKKNVVDEEEPQIRIDFSVIMLVNTAFILENLDRIALLTGGIFTGTAIYIGYGQYNALVDSGIDQHWKFFAKMYAHSGKFQVGLALAAGLASLTRSLRLTDASARKFWLKIAMAYLGMIPFTIVFMGSTIKRILGDNRATQSGQYSQVDNYSRKELLGKWRRLHLIRTLFAVAGFIAMINASRRH